jgi:hypothetical protein
LREGLGQAGEVGDHGVDAGDRANPQDGGAGNDQQHLMAFGFGSLVRGEQGVQRSLPRGQPGLVDREVMSLSGVGQGNGGLSARLRFCTNSPQCTRWEC